MQEAYRLPCSEYSFCCPNWVPPPHPDLAGGVPCQGVPYLGTPHTGPGGYPARGYPTWVPPIPHPDLGTPPHPGPGGYPAMGVPCLGTPHPGLGGYPAKGIAYLHTPCPGLGGYPAGGTLPGYPQQGTPHPDLAGYPPQLDLTGYPPSVCPMAFWVMLQSIMGYGYPPRYGQTDGWTDTCQNITFPSYYVRGR